MRLTKSIKLGTQLIMCSAHGLRRCKYALRVRHYIALALHAPRHNELRGLFGLFVHVQDTLLEQSVIATNLLQVMLQSGQGTLEVMHARSGPIALGIGVG